MKKKTTNKQINKIPKFWTLQVFGVKKASIQNPAKVWDK